MSKISGIACRISVLLLIVVALSACVENYRPLSMDHQQKLATADVYVYIKQQEIYALIERSNMAAGGGLLFALADSAINNQRAKEQEEYVRPIRDSLIGYDFGTALTGAFSRQMQTVGWPQIRKVTFVREYSKEKLADVVAESTADAVLFLNADYAFVPNFNRLRVATAASIYIKTSPKPDPDMSPVYLNAALVMTEAAKKDMSKEDAVQFWAADNAGRTRASLEKGAALLAKMISYDLKSDRVAEERLEKADIDPIFTDVKLVSKEDDCLIGRLPVNTLKSYCSVK